MKGGIGIIARLGSKRLFDKHLQMANDIPIVNYLIERIKYNFREEMNRGEIEVSLLSGNRTNNEPLGLEFISLGAETYYGNDSNIPKRILQSMNHFQWDFIICVDGDDIFCSPEAMRNIYHKMISGSQYAQTLGLPFGMNAMGVRKNYLERSLINSRNSSLETGWGWIFDKNDLDVVEFQYDFPDYLRFTLDYENDLLFFKAVIAQCEKWKTISDDELIKLVIDNKLFIHNKDLMVEYWENFHREQNLEKGIHNG
jgi:spore coat polysaccharide biosynthesis protein SpsF (cytidylyltransferase family)